ncbi:hypothetical protein H1R20_g15008, partial [Candolleomyces eurysporus]
MPRVVERPRKFRCSLETCKRRFGSESDRQRHERIHTGVKPFVCEVCNKGFPQYTGLKTHRNIHTGAKPHECSFCCQAFADPSSKARHEKETHRCLGTYKCPAPKCPVGIKRRSAFVVHLREKHGLDKDSVDIDACAPTILPKVTRKARAEKTASLISGASSKVTEKPATHRITRSSKSQMVIPMAPPMIQSMPHLQPVSGGKSSKLSVEDDERHWYEDKLGLSHHDGDLTTHWDLPGLAHTFAYAGEPEIMYPPPPSYSVATSIDPSHPHQFVYSADFSPLHPEPYVLHSTPRPLTPQLDFSSPDSSPVTPRVSSTLCDSHLSPRQVMPTPHCFIPISMPGSRPVTPMGMMQMPLPAYLTEFPEPYHHQSSGKGAYHYPPYEPATGVHGIHG